MSKIKEIREQFDSNKLKHLAVCGNTAGVFADSAVFQCKRNLAIENYTYFQHDRITLRMDVFAKYEFVNALTTYAEEQMQSLDFVFTNLDIETCLVSGTLMDWVLFISYCTAKELKTCMWRYKLCEVYPDIFSSLVTEQVIAEEVVGAEYVADREVYRRYSEYERHLSMTVKFVCDAEIVLCLMSQGLRTYLTLQHVNDAEVMCYLTATIATWKALLRKVRICNLDDKIKERVIEEITNIILYGAWQKDKTKDKEGIPIEFVNSSNLVADNESVLKDLFTERETHNIAHDNYKTALEELSNKFLEELKLYKTVSDALECAFDASEPLQCGENGDTLLLLSEDMSDSDVMDSTYILE